MTRLVGVVVAAALASPFDSVPFDVARGRPFDAAQGTQPPVFRARTDLVRLDVVVVDATLALGDLPPGDICCE